MDERQYIISFLATIKGNKAVVSGLRQIEKASGKVAPAVNSAGGAMNGFEKSLGGVIKRALITIPVWFALRMAIMAVIRTITTIVKSQSELQDGLARIRTVVHGTASEIEKAMVIARESIITMAFKSDKSLKELSEAFYFLQTSALSSEQAISAFEPTVNAMIGTGTGAKQMARAVAGAFNTMGSSMNATLTDAEKFKKIADVLTFTFATQDVEMTELVEGYGKLAPFVTGLEDEFSILITILGVLNTKLLRGGRTGRLLGRTILQLTKNSEKLGHIFGIVFEEDKPINFLNTIRQINNILGQQGKITAGQQKALQEIFATRGAVAPKLLLQDFQAIEEALVRVTNESEGFAEKIKEIRLRTVSAQGKRFVIIMSALTSEFIDGGAFGDKFAMNLESLNDEMEKGRLSARKYGENLAEVLYYWNQINNLIQKKTGIRLSEMLQPLDFLLKEIEKRTNIFSKTGEMTVRLIKGGLKKLGLQKELAEFEEGIEQLRLQREIIDGMDNKFKEFNLTFEQRKAIQSVITEAYKIQLGLLKAVGSSEFEILQAKESQLIASRQSLSAEQYALKLGALRLQQQVALTKENEKQLGTLRNLAVRFEQASGLDKGRIFRLMELVQLDPNELIEAFERGQGDRNTILANLSTFSKEQNKAISDYILELRSLPGLDKLKEQSKLKAETMDLQNFMKDFETQTPTDFWNNWTTKGLEAINKFRAEFNKVSGNVTATGAPTNATGERVSPQGYVINSEGVRIEIGDIIINAESKEEIEKTATDALLKKLRGDTRYQKIIGDALSDDV